MPFIRSLRRAAAPLVVFRGSLLVIAVLGGLLFTGDPAMAEVTRETFTYKKVGDLAIKADVYREQDDKVRPVVVWIHGGALINGHREGLINRWKDAVLKAGYILVSIDYRLAPETQLPEIIKDVEDALSWIHDEGPAKFNADPKRIAVTGGSAGGYLTFIAGQRARPRPVALVAFWGYGEVVGEWYSKPSPHPCHHMINYSREEAFKQVAGPAISDSRDRKGNGSAFYQFCRQQGIWPKEVTGWDPVKEESKFVPYMPLRNVTKDYPPTFMIHGDKDTDVPYEESVMMAAELKKHGVEHRLVTIAGGEHGLAGGDPAKIDEAYKAALEFLKTKLK